MTTISGPPNLSMKNVLWLMLLLVCCSGPDGVSQDRRLTLQRLVTPSTLYVKDGQPVTFAIHGFIEFRTLEEFFQYVDDQAGKWEFDSEEARREFADRLFHRGVESRLVSMVYEKPLEVLLTHTEKEIQRSVASLNTRDQPVVYQGKHWTLTPKEYGEKLLAVQERWKTSMNCWSATSSIAGRVLSNWYLIDEGIQLFGATYDSTEHFWQAVKFHPTVKIRDLHNLLRQMADIDWQRWVEKLARDQEFYFQNGYAVEFLRKNLEREHLDWFGKELRARGLAPGDSARTVQQRDPQQPELFRFTAMDEKILWGDLADVFHLIYCYSRLENGRFQSPEMGPLLEALARLHFDGIYLEGYESGKVGFLSSEFQLLMYEIWKTKYLQMERFKDVIRSTKGMKLDHYLNDGDSPDIPIPVYVGYLNRIREEALKKARP